MTGDLHMHSYYSDGFYSPETVMQKAKTAGCEIVALTDHDTLDGIEEANRAAHKLNIKNVTGVEISTFGGVDAHILGYGFDRFSDEFNSFMNAQKEGRRERAQLLLSRLADHGIKIPIGEFDFAVKREISRAHIAAAIVRLGYEPDFHTAMRKWLYSGAATYVPTRGASPEAAINAIHLAGGLAVLAHPVRLDLDSYERTDFIKRLKAAGLDGIEAVYKRSSRETVKEFRELADRLNLFVTAGADYHGDSGEIIPREQSPLFDSM